MRSSRQRGFAAPFALVTGFGALFALGTLAAALHAWFPPTVVLIAAAAVVTVLSFVAEPLAAIPLGVVGWLTAVGFSHPPYGQLRVTGPFAGRSAIVMAACVLAAGGLGLLLRRSADGHILEGVGNDAGLRGAGAAAGRDDRGLAAGSRPAAEPSSVLAKAAYAVGARRALTGVLVAAAGLPLLTLLLALARNHLSLTDDLLIYLVAVVALAVFGGFWPAVLGAAAASLLLNWYFTPPPHTFTIDKPDNLLALLLFVTVAMLVSSVVHLAASRAGQAARSREEARLLLTLAQTVLGGADTPAEVLDHLVVTLGGQAELLEHVGGHWVRIAASGGDPDQAAPATRVEVRTDLALEVSGQPAPIAAGLLAGFAAQAAAALDRERLRTQAAQAEALAEGNRMRTALLAAVSHDLRTPLASIKASVSTLRQTGVHLSAEDEAALLATTEESADRLNDLIGNLLDMSRLAAGSLEPFLRPASIDEVAPLARHEAESSSNVRLIVPDELPLVRTDPGLLERVLANLFANAIAHSPAGRPAVISASHEGDLVRLDVVDHGSGVPDELKPRMFEPFERLGRGGGTGVGLGLAVAKGFLSAMGGTVTPLDTPGGGLTMRVTLPVATPASST